MIQFLWFCFWSATIVPLFLITIRPVYKVDAQQYMNYIMRRITKQTITSDEQFIEKGFILANHRSWADFCIDQTTASASILGRRMAFYATFGISSMTRLDNRAVIFTRGRDSRQDIYDKCVKHIQKSDYKRIVFFPEGTRMKYTTLDSVDEVKSYLKYGLLKEIYNDKRFPVQIMISNNKEVVFNENKFIMNYGVNVRTHITKPIWPNDYNTDSEFYDEIANQWYDAWKKTHVIV
jgi:hypothetical protein